MELKCLRSVKRNGHKKFCVDSIRTVWPGECSYDRNDWMTSKNLRLDKKKKSRDFNEMRSGAGRRGHHV
jgi:hypothetical protein